MRTFFLDRIEDESKISGVGRVAQGVEFDDGSCCLRWLTERRSTSLYANIKDVLYIHGHGGKTKITWIDDPTLLVEIPKPHLSLGFEGPDAEFEAATCNCGPVLPGVRAAYDRLGKIYAPRGWVARVTFFVSGQVSLTVSGPEEFLYTSTHEADFNGVNKVYTISHYRHSEAKFVLSATELTAIKECGAPEPYHRVVVGGVDGLVFTLEYSRR